MTAPCGGIEGGAKAISDGRELTTSVADGGGADLAWWVSAKVVHFLWRMPADSSGEDTMSVKKLVVVAHLFQVPCRPTLTRSLLAISILLRANPLVAYGMAVLARGGLP